MPIRLTSQKDPNKSLIVTDAAWYALLDLAEDYGWHPYSPILPGFWNSMDLDLDGYPPSPSGYAASHSGDAARRLVTLDDALNLADALEHAFMDYEPQRVPTSFYFFTPDAGDPALGLGVLTALIEISALGAFWLEIYPV